MYRYVSFSYKIIIALQMHFLKLLWNEYSIDIIPFFQNLCNAMQLFYIQSCRKSSDT